MVFGKFKTSSVNADFIFAVYDPDMHESGNK
jgi:hypothetical protein